MEGGGDLTRRRRPSSKKWLGLGRGVSDTGISIFQADVSVLKGGVSDMAGGWCLTHGEGGISEANKTYLEESAA